MFLSFVLLFNHVWIVYRNPSECSFIHSTFDSSFVDNEFHTIRQGNGTECCWLRLQLSVMISERCEPKFYEWKASSGILVSVDVVRYTSLTFWIKTLNNNALCSNARTLTHVLGFTTRCVSIHSNFFPLFFFDNFVCVLSCSCCIVIQCIEEYTHTLTHTRTHRLAINCLSAFTHVATHAILNNTFLSPFMKSWMCMCGCVCVPMS